MRSLVADPHSADRGTRIAGPLAILCLTCAVEGAAADDQDTAHTLVKQTIADTCAIRKLPIRHAVAVRPMTAFEGGYTKGIGSTVWEARYADTWREGWCAVGVYCHAPDETETAGAVRGDRPRGLYDHAANILYVNTEAKAFHSTVAHEFTHALQYQNYPALNALHLWYNRDLAAAGNTVVEGGAHVVGWSFRPSQRLQLCMMAPDDGTSRQPHRWDWAADDFKAHEMFPHAFGPAISLEALLARGTEGLDAMLEDPPLSTLAVMRPARAGPVDFIRLPVAALKATLPDCEIGLRNTVGAVGIWGLLRTHGDDTETLPGFIDAWTGDRFVHFACPDRDDDEFAWLSRWGNAEAAREFAQRWRGIASAIVPYGGVLRTGLTVYRRDRLVIVVTPGIEDALPRIQASEVRSFSRFGDWIASGCFPQQRCYDPARAGDPHGRLAADAGSCPSSAEAPPVFADWLSRVRRGRNPAMRRIGDAETLAEEAGRLAVFCATNTAGNTDLGNACRAGYGGVGYLARLASDPDWQLLPTCLGSQDFRAWLENAHYPDADRPFAHTSIVPTTYGAALAARALERSGPVGLRALLNSPPLSTLAVLRPALAAPTEFIRLPRAALAARGCRVDATDSQGVLGMWNILMDYGKVPEEDTLPAFLQDWRGDRQSFIRCGENGDPLSTGWIWVSRWRTPGAARAFASHFRALPASAAEETGLTASAGVHVDHRTVWIVAPELDALAPLIKGRIESRVYSDFRDWVADGCFPRSSCNQPP